MAMQIAERLNFINSLTLEEEIRPYASLMLRLHDNPRTAFIDGGSAVSFVAGVTSLSQRDALNSCLLAQLAANKQYNRENDTVNWYNFYKTSWKTLAGLSRILLLPNTTHPGRVSQSTRWFLI